MNHRILLSAACIGLMSPACAEQAGFHAALADCADAVAAGELGFSRAANVEGNADQGFIAWYNDPTGTPIYGTRLGTEGDVTICSGPEAMGPFFTAYERDDSPKVHALAKAFDLVKLGIEAPGEYFADCNAENPRLLLAIQIDPTQRVGFKFVSSPHVAQSCNRFAPA